MLQLTPQMRILVALDPIDGRKGIDSLVQLCRQKLDDDPFSGCVFMFRTRGGSVIKLLAYDGQGFWLAQKRLSAGRFKWWPQGPGPAQVVESYQAQMLLAAGDPAVRAAPAWKPLHPGGRPEARKSPSPGCGSLSA
jgi:transposase